MSRSVRDFWVLMGVIVVLACILALMAVIK